MEQDDLDRILNSRMNAPMARADLAERIIHAALADLPARQKAQNIWAELLSMFVIPHPSVAVAAGVILGLLVGIEAGDGLAVLQQDWSSFLDINEGGWL